MSPIQSRSRATRSSPAPAVPVARRGRVSLPTATLALWTFALAVPTIARADGDPARQPADAQAPPAPQVQIEIPLVPELIPDDSSPDRPRREVRRVTAAEARRERPAVDVRRCLSDLSDDSPAVRDAARVKLMGLDRGDLPKLRATIAASAALTPAQVAVLREVVEHVYIAGEPYDTWTAPKGEPQGMLGLRWTDGVAGGDVRSDLGVVVDERIQGFEAYRLLRSGDILLRIVDHPDVDLHSRIEFTNAIRHLPAGTVVPFEVLRQGQVIRVDVPLSARPVIADQLDAAHTWDNERQHQAEDYFDREFAPLLREQLATGD